MGRAWPPTEQHRELGRDEKLSTTGARFLCHARREGKIALRRIGTLGTLEQAIRN